MFCPGISGALIRDLLHQQKIGLGIEDLETEICLRLTNYNTSLQAEIQAITDDLIWLSTKTKPTTINILRDSKLAIEAIAANTIMLRTIINYITAFNSYSQMGSVLIINVQHHKGLNLTKNLPNLPNSQNFLGT